MFLTIPFTCCYVLTDGKLNLNLFKAITILPPPDFVRMAKLWREGHSTAILCVTASPGPEGLIASGSEGGEVAVWSQEGCVLGRFNLPGEEDCTSVAFSPSAPDLVYVSHGKTVSSLDPRNLNGTVEEFVGAGEEEINALALNESGSTLALADDSGVVRILELPGGKVCRTLRRHTNICSSVAFRPHRPNNVVSAGLDMQVRTLHTISDKTVTRFFPLIHQHNDLK